MDISLLMPTSVQIEWHDPPSPNDLGNWICHQGCYPCDSQGHVLWLYVDKSTVAAPIYFLTIQQRHELGVVWFNKTLLRNLDPVIQAHALAIPHKALYMVGTTLWIELVNNGSYFVQFGD